MKYIAFSENLKTLRKKAGLSRRELAERISYSEKSVEKWESGEATPPLQVICELSEILCTPLESLVYKDEKEVSFLLGVDGGGTKTSFLLTDLEGQRISYLELGSSNPNDIGMEGCLSLLKSGVMQITENVDRKRVAAYFGIAGGGISGDNEFVIKKMLSGLGFAVFGNGSDVDNVLELTLGDSDGIALIAGTGVIGFGKKGNKLIRCGGWGYLIDGGGSGYNIGRDALEASFCHIDKRGTPTALTAAIEKHFGKDIRDAIPEIYKGGKRFIASLTPIVFETAALGDSVAIEIIRRNACALARIINTLYKNFDDPSITIAICGGLVAHRGILEGYILDDLDFKASLIFVTKPTVNGAILLAKKLAANICNT